MNDTLESSRDIEKISLNILKDSRSFGVLPTPVDNIVNYIELKVNQNIDLCRIEPDFISKAYALLAKAKSKVLGVLDFFKKEIYLDSTLNNNKKRFIKLHEVGHKSLPWQQEIYEYFLDDKHSLDLNTKMEFESQANYFASGTLFQFDFFDYMAKNLPLTIESPFLLANKFGASNHATLRRYVEYSYKRCALLVFESLNEKYMYKIRVRNYFQSQPFTNEFGELKWPETMGLEFSFMNYVYVGKKGSAQGEFNCILPSIGSVEFQYYFFNNTYNTFVFLLPKGENNKSKTKVFLSNKFSSYK